MTMTRLQTLSAIALLSTPSLVSAQTAPVLFPPVNLNPAPDYTQPPPPPPPPPSVSVTIPGTNATVTPGGIPPTPRDPRIDPAPPPAPPPENTGVGTVTIPLPE
jgi:hypothetical protein